MYFVCITAAPGWRFVYIIQSMSEGRRERTRPVIGLVADSRPASFGAWSRGRTSTSSGATTPRRSNGQAERRSSRPPRSYLAEDPELLLSRVDGLLLTGGRDIDASSYGAEASPGERCSATPSATPSSQRWPAPRSSGACRCLASAAGCRCSTSSRAGRSSNISRTPRASTAVPPAPSSPIPWRWSRAPCSPESSARRRPRSAPTTTRGSARSAPGCGSAGAARDGVVEAFEGGDGGFCLAVLWHPEEDLDGGGLAIYEALVEAASERGERVTG